MKKLQGLYILIIFFSLFISCKSGSSGKEDRLPIKEYPFDILETTGIRTRLVVDDEVVYIRYHADSNSKRLRVFLALRWYILNFNCEADANSRIVVIGRLHNEIRKNEDYDEMSFPEYYREFELVDWYIKAPFNQLAYDGKRPFGLMDDPEKIKMIEREQLVVEDFRPFAGIKFYNLHRHVRK